MEDQSQPAGEAAPLLCSECFRNSGLRLDALRLGRRDELRCPYCGSADGAKLTANSLMALAHRFFVVGSLHKTEYGGAPVIEFNEHRRSEIDHDPFHGEDAALLCETLGIGFFYYGPPLWRIGEVEPLKALQAPDARGQVVDRILAEYPEVILTPEQPFYRLRKGLAAPADPAEYDSPPHEFCGNGRLDSPELPVLYGSADLEVCVHECRVAAEDVAHVATLSAFRPLRLLDLTALLKEDVTSFESLDMAVHMLFLASAHSYPISRAVAAAAARGGFDGLLFPSYFSLLRTGQPFLETAWGLSSRVFSGAADWEKEKVVPNIGLFGRPIADGRVTVSCINRVYLRQVAYDLGFGPAST